MVPEEHITFTRGRPYRKNDQAYVEQKNWSVLRRVIGYDRFCSRDAFLALQAVHELLRPYVNFFQPLCKLVSKERHGARVLKRYDRAQTPYRRLLASGTLAPDRATRSPPSISASILASCAPTSRSGSTRSGSSPIARRPTIR